MSVDRVTYRSASRVSRGARGASTRGRAASSARAFEGNTSVIAGCYFFETCCFQLRPRCPSFFSSSVSEKSFPYIGVRRDPPRDPP